MEEKDKRELSLDEMDMVNGGLLDTEENRKYESEYRCQYCKTVFNSYRELSRHIKTAHPVRA